MIVHAMRRATLDSIAFRRERKYGCSIATVTLARTVCAGDRHPHHDNALRP